MAYATKNYHTDGGNTWVVGGKMIFEEGATVEGLQGGGGSSYTLPTASASTLGGVKVGSGLSITDGVLSADGVPTASASTLGGVKVGSGLSITDGVLSADGVPTASADTLGGVKVGSGLSIADGVLSATAQPSAAATTTTAGVVKMAENQAEVSLSNIMAVETAFNGLLQKLKAAGIMAPDNS